MSRTWLYVLLTSVMITWGLNVIAVKWIIGAFTPLTITAVRIFIASLSLLPILLLRRLIQRLNRKELLYLSLITLTGVFVHHFCLAVGLAQTSSANGGLILGTVPIVTSILAAVLLGVRLSFFRIAGLLSGFFGVLLIMLTQHSDTWHFSWGDLFVFLAVLAQAISFIFIKKVTATMEAAAVTGLSQLFGSLLLFFVALSLEPHGLASLREGTLFDWCVVLASGVLATGMGHFIYNTAIQKVGTVEAAVFLNMTPFFSLLGSVVLLGETLLAQHWISFLCVAAGVFLGTGIADEWMWNKKWQRPSTLDSNR
ncbi:MAG: hypothetical protein A6D91_09865 [Bacillaceae bacterium G1]|nr:EamA family transporter [Bacillota bacterium]OJF17838.1 MAG: hypothetical protein A6D91_09865 [Bacillaceae bacterium G1]